MHERTFTTSTPAAALNRVNMRFFEEVQEDDYNEASSTTSPTANENMSKHVLTAKPIYEETPVEVKDDQKVNDN